MFGLGWTEVLVILLVIVIVFGGSRLPQLGKGLGEAMRNFREAFKGVSADDDRRAIDSRYANESQRSLKAVSPNDDRTSQERTPSDDRRV